MYNNNVKDVLKCKRENHGCLPLNLVCVEENCQNERIACPYCIMDNHSGHIKNKMSIDLFFSAFKTKYSHLIDELKNLDSICKKLNDTKIIQNYVSLLEKSLDQIKLDFIQKIDNYKTNLKYYIDLTKLNSLSKMYETFQQEHKNIIIYNVCKNNIFEESFVSKPDQIDEMVDIYLNEKNLESFNSMIVKLDKYNKTILKIQKDQENTISSYIELGLDASYYVENKLKEFCNKLNKYFLDLFEEFEQNNKYSQNVRPSEIQKLSSDIKIDLKYLKKDQSNNLCIACSHYISNYVSLFNCCDKQHPCYLCHELIENHKTTLFKGVLCLFCGTLSKNFNKCNRCNTKFYMIY